MNKKVLTLCAGLLLSGSAFAQTAGVDWVASAPNGALDNAGKYWQLETVNNYITGSSWSSTGDYYLTIKNGSLVMSQKSDLLDESSYWTFKVIPLTAGENYPQPACKALVEIVNQDGYTLTLDKSTHQLATDATTAANKISRFYVMESDNDNLILAYFPVETDNTTYYALGYNSPSSDSGLTYPVAGKKVGVENYALSWNIIDIDEEAIQVQDMNAELNGGFMLDFSSKGKEYPNLVGAEAFSGKLTAVSSKYDKTGVTDTEKNEDKVFYLKNANNEYIILSDDYIGDADATLNGTKSAFYRGYNFKTISEHAFEQLTDTEKKNAQFKVFKSYDFNDTDSLIVTLPNVEKIGKIDATAAANDLKGEGLRVFVSSVNVAGVKSNMLTTIAYTKCNDRLADVEDNNYDDPKSQLGALAPYISFTTEVPGSIVDIPATFAGKIWNITRGAGENEQSMSPVVDADIDSYEQLFAPISQVDLTNPEGQWLLYKKIVDEKDQYYFVNRESGARFNIANTLQDDAWVIRLTDTAGKYEICKNPYTDKWETVYITKAKDAELGLASENGYVKFDMDKELVNGKYFSFETGLGVTAYVGKDADDNVVLTTNKDEAIEFRVKQLSHDFRDHDGELAPDTLVHYTSYLKYNAKKELVTDVDTLRFFQYALYENFSEKYLKYDKVNKKFVLSDKSYTGNAHENFDQEGANYAFIVKEKEDGSYILVRDYAIDYDYCTGSPKHDVYDSWNYNKKDDGSFEAVPYSFDNIFEVNFWNNAYAQKEAYNVEDRNKITYTKDDGENIENPYTNYMSHKAYAATQPGTLSDMSGIYNYNDNDRIVMEDTDKAEYMTVTGTQDTVKISLEAKPNFYLYEQGRFLGMEHVADADMKAAILADTAYVRNNTYRPQYLLAVGTNIVDKVWDNHPNSPSKPHLVSQDTVYGRFLVNMVDSAKTYGLDKKSNPYIWEELNGNPYFKLAFIDGYHTTDTLYLNTAKQQTKIALDNNKDKVCTFAFRYTDESREGVKIETAYGPADNQGNRSRGWLKYQNNVPVVTNDYEDAHVFLVNTEVEEAPTANEEIAAGNVVVAGTNGAVVVKGAEGKNVIVSTILGKVVANEVVSSDNVTIAAPAGVVVVSVDGESFKVVVK